MKSEVGLNTKIGNWHSFATLFVKDNGGRFIQFNRNAKSFKKTVLSKVQINRPFENMKISEEKTGYLRYKYRVPENMYELQNA